MDKKIVFIHIPKTAGSSMRKHLEDCELTYQILGFPLRPKFDPDIQITNTEHLSLQSLVDRDIVPQQWFDEAFKFAFIRNPWDRLVSLYESLQYRHRQKRERESNAYLHSFGDFVTAVCSDDLDFVRPVGKLVTDDWSQANPQVCWLQWGTDFIGSFENLDDDWRILCDMIGIDHSPLNHSNRSKNRLSFDCYYHSSDLVDKVGEYYQEDIETFGYEFSRSLVHGN
jgi:hypothetical protein